MLSQGWECMEKLTVSEPARRSEFGAAERSAPIYKGLVIHSHYLVMRDGVKLAADVVLPKGLPAGAEIPALLSQSRYWRDMELKAPFKWFLKSDDLQRSYRGFRPFFTGRGYALVLVDVRGTGASFGTWPYPWHEDCHEDAYEVVDWIVNQPWSNGRVGAYGVSYMGNTAELLAAIQHPAVKAAIPMFNHPDPYADIAFPGGLFNERFIREWGRLGADLDSNQLPEMLGVLPRLVVRGVKPVDSDDNRQLLQEALRGRSANGDVYRIARDVTYRDEKSPAIDGSMADITVEQYKEQLAASGVAICGWGSWMDAGTADAILRRFLTLDNANQAVIGAWEHGGRLHASPYQKPNQPPNPSPESQWAEMIRFFEPYLKEEGLASRPKPAEKCLFYYTMGEERWKRTPVWPPEGTAMSRWYLDKPNILSPKPPSDESGAGTYLVDFEASSGEFNRWWEAGSLLQESVSYPDRHEAHAKLLTYTSLPLAEDLEITGYPVVTLHLTSTEPDFALYVYLEEVTEDGQVTYITEGQLRAIHRQVSQEKSAYRLQVPYHSFKEADALPVEPGEITEISFGLLPTSVLVRKGRHISLSIAGHDAGNFARIPAEGRPELTVQRNSLYPSHIDLPLVPSP